MKRFLIQEYVTEQFCLNDNEASDFIAAWVKLSILIFFVKLVAYDKIPSTKA